MAPGRNNEPQSHGISETFRRLESKLDGVIADLGELRVEMATVQATVEAGGQRVRDESAALFESRAKHEERISKIERSYTPREAHEQLANKVEAVKSASDRTAWTPSVVSAIGAAVLAVLGNMALMLSKGGGQ